MATIAVLHKVDEKRVADDLNEVVAKLGNSDGEVVLDCSSLQCIPPSAVQALALLATTAETKATKIVLLGVNVHVYKVLKLARLTSQFSFVN
jgi:anti-anti-sigma regulatory factor